MEASYRPLTGADVLVKINGVFLGAAKRLRAAAKRELHPIEAVGSANLEGLAPGPASYQIELSRLRLEGLENAPDFFELSNFQLEIILPGGVTTYGGCQWSQLEEVAEPNTRYLETAVFSARTRSAALAEENQ